MSVMLVNLASVAYILGSTPSLTIAAPTIGNTLVFLITSFSVSPTVSQVTHGADNFVQAASARGTNSSGTTTMTDIWYVLSTGNTGTTINVTLSGNGRGTLRCYEYSGTNISFAAAAGTTDLALTATPIGASASISGTNGFMVAVGTDLLATFNSTLANGGDTYASVDTTNGELGVDLLNVAAGPHAPEFQLSVADATISISNAAFNEGAVALSAESPLYSFLPGFGGGR